jgi:cytochrome c
MKTRFVLIPAAGFLLVGMATLSSLAGEPDSRSGPQKGKEVFTRRCSGCHALDSNKEGPRLRGVLNRKAGTAPGFLYSEALRNAGFTWDEDRLNQWLQNPDAVVKDTDMEFRLSNPDERAAVIAWLKSAP